MTRALALPRNAQRFADMRRAGVRPSDTLVVSFVGPTRWGNRHVYAERGMRYDWQWMRGLDIALVVREGIDASDAIRVLADPLRIAENVAYAMLVDVDACEAACILPGPKLWQIVSGSDMWLSIFGDDDQHQGL